MTSSIKEHGASPALARVPDLELARTYEKRIIGKTKKTDFQIYGYAFDNGFNVLLEGPTGCGKTRSVASFAAQMQVPFYAMPCHVGVEGSQLFGKYIPKSDGEGFEWQDGPVTSIIRHGGILLINEVNFMPERISTILFGLLDYRRTVTLLDHKGEQITAHNCDLDGNCETNEGSTHCIKRVMVVADMNPGYSGTRALNQAFRNRFAIQMAFDYSRPIENKLVGSKSLTDWAHATRTSGSFDTPLSTNMLVEFKKIAQFSWELAIENMGAHYTDDERNSLVMSLEPSKDKILAEIDPNHVAPVVEEEEEEPDSDETEEYAQLRKFVEYSINQQVN